MYEILEGLLQVISWRSSTVYGGIKSTGQIVKEVARRGQFSPDKTDINFAVPTQKVWPNLKVLTLTFQMKLLLG